MSLPKWFDGESLCDCNGCEYAIKMHDALTIAWEALDYITCSYDEAKNDCGICEKGIFSGHTKYCIVPSVQEAMRRIEELGK